MSKNIRLILSKDRIGFVDVGASGGLGPRWQQVADQLNYFMFEPDQRSYEGLQRTREPNRRIFPVALSDRPGERKFFLCRKPQVSSYYPPNKEFLAHFLDGDRFDVIDETVLKADTLDNCLSAHRESIDFLKLDTQGSELDILKGGRQILDTSLIGLEVEVEFCLMYKNQPLFGDVCKYLSERGFEFFDFVNIYRWRREESDTQFGQCVFADALYLIPPEALHRTLKERPADDPSANRKVRKYLAILAIYDRVDLMPVCLDLFANFLSDSEKASVRTVYAAMLRKRKWVTLTSHWAWRFMNLFGYKPFPVQLR